MPSLRHGKHIQVKFRNAVIDRCMFLVKAAVINNANTKGRSASKLKQNAYSGLQTFGITDGLTLSQHPEISDTKVDDKTSFCKLFEQCGDLGTRARLVRL